MCIHALSEHLITPVSVGLFMFVGDPLKKMMVILVLFIVVMTVVINGGRSGFIGSAAETAIAGVV